MKQIRICIDPDVIYEQSVARPCTDWIDDSADARTAFEVLIKAGNERYGENTHWLEERDM
ncbi:hypothetical protein SAMN05216344_102151 [Polaromonas sp. OV174]|uniref:hypothetical protein n=1 Tax=Polaromonas sp. OV174 TaxID=1855300 RepID=UPI0008E7BA90|nr:hypothetical protein [Polaromonas sp. OV174]SFB73903.1 hypothetical protein SAMN05216344_102151 [Polaromonas sp. OV174]